MQTDTKSKYILIVGAGIAGLSLAHLLEKAGINYKIIEKRASIQDQGFGIALPANAVKALRYMKLGEQVDAIAHQVKNIIYTTASNKLLSQASLLDAPLNLDKFVALPRKVLINLLAAGLEDKIHFSTEITNISETEEGIHIRFNDTTIEYFSTVIGADGVHSFVRKSILPEVELLDLGLTTWRWLANYQETSIEPTYMFGKQEIFMAYPIGNQQLYCYAHIADPEKVAFHHADKRTLLASNFKRFKGLAKILLQQLPNDEAITAGRLITMPIPYFGKGRIALIGDAGNACSPLLQQGAACAFEDAITLVELLKKFPETIAVQRYEEQRKERVNWIVATSDGPFKNSRHKKTALFYYLRNQFIKKNGPLNVQGWRYLLSTCPLENINKLSNAL